MCFSFSPGFQVVMNVIVNNLDSFRDFFDFFKTRAPHLLTRAEIQKIILDLTPKAYKDGVRLYTTEVSKKFLNESEIKSYTLSNLIKIPTCLALLDGNSKSHYLNEEALLVCGHTSLKSAMGKSIE